MRKGRPSDNEILVKLETLKKSAQDHNCFSVAMKFDIRIKEHKRKRIKKVYKKWTKYNYTGKKIKVSYYFWFH